MINYVKGDLEVVANLRRYANALLTVFALKILGSNRRGVVEQVVRLR